MSSQARLLCSVKIVLKNEGKVKTSCTYKNRENSFTIPLHYKNAKRNPSGWKELRSDGKPIVSGRKKRDQKGTKGTQRIKS